jgi:hypothetical protein
MKKGRAISDPAFALHCFDGYFFISIWVNWLDVQNLHSSLFYASLPPFFLSWGLPEFCPFQFFRILRR